MVNCEQNKLKSYDSFLKDFNLIEPEILDTKTCSKISKKEIEKDKFTKNDILLRIQAKRNKWNKEAKNETI